MKIKALLFVVLLLALGVGLAVWLVRGLHRGGKPAGKAPAIPEVVAPAKPVPPPEVTMANFQLAPVRGVAGREIDLPAKLGAAAANCTSGILIDWSTKEILWAKNADTPVPIASMTKMMTALLLMEAMHKDHRVTMQTMVRVTPAAAKIGGSEVWLDPRESFTIEDLTKCLMIKSANDAAYLIGEFLAGGDSAAFVAQMNQRARELGCTSMTFYNAHGLPPDAKSPVENRATSRELALLAIRLLDYPDLMYICSIKIDWLRKDTKKPTELFNHNLLITRHPCAGVDGLKTGLTARSGHCITATCLRNGRRMIAVVNGAPTAVKRDELAAALFEWGYATQAARAPLKPAPVVPAVPAPEAPGPAPAPGAGTPPPVPPHA